MKQLHFMTFEGYSTKKARERFVLLANTLDIPVREEQITTDGRLIDRVELWANEREWQTILNTFRPYAQEEED